MVFPIGAILDVVDSNGFHAVSNVEALEHKFMITQMEFQSNSIRNSHCSNNNYTQRLFE